MLFFRISRCELHLIDSHAVAVAYGWASPSGFVIGEADIIAHLLAHVNILNSLSASIYNASSAFISTSETFVQAPSTASKAVLAYLGVVEGEEDANKHSEIRIENSPPKRNIFESSSPSKREYRLFETSPLSRNAFVAWDVCVLND